MKMGRNIAITIVCIILGITLAWQYKSISFNQKTVSYENKRSEELKDELLSEKHNNEELKKKIDEVEKQNKEYENARGDVNEKEKILKSELERARIIAGLTTVKGKGIIVTIDNNDISTVGERNILDVLNELRASDAQAISVNDERIVASSEVRKAGGYIMINGKQMLAPYVIKAIADPANLENSLKIIGGVKEDLELIYQLKVEVEKSDNLVIPKVRDDGSVIKTDLLTPANN